MELSGRAVVLGDDIDTDVIYPARYLSVLDRKEQATHLFETLGPTFLERLAGSTIVVGGENFGCGSSREHAVTSMIGHGITCVIAKSFARIFFRNCINIGLPALQCPQLVDAVADGGQVEVDLSNGKAWLDGESFDAIALPPKLRGLMKAGGLWASRSHAG